MAEFRLKDYLRRDGFYLTQGYGVNAANYSKYGLLYHEGIDLGNTNKTAEIRALHNGIVVQDWDEPKGNYGSYVVIWDDAQKCATWYCHLSANYVDYGQRVKAGDVIGRMGTTGNVTGPHLHLNFVLTNAAGARLYNAASSNLGLLDPQHPLDPNPPKFPPGVPAYTVKWELPTSSEGQNMGDMDKWLANSDKWRGLVWYLKGENTNPEETPLQAIKDVIEGIRSRVTDLTNQLSGANAELTNRTEQVSRLKAQLLDEAKLANDRYNALKSQLDSAGSEVPSLEARIGVLQSQVEDLAKEKGSLVSELATCKAQSGEAVENSGILAAFVKLIKKLWGGQ